MTELGIIPKLIKKRKEDFITTTKSIGEVYGDKLSKVFSILYKKPELQIHWEKIDLLSDKTVNVSGKFKLTVGEVVTVGEERVVITAENENSYNSYTTFSFPINMLEYASIEELVEFVTKISTAGGALSVDAESVQKLIEEEFDLYQNKLLNDPKKLEELTNPVTTKIIHGFTTEGLTEDQILKLSWYNPETEQGSFN